MNATTPARRLNIDAITASFPALARTPHGRRLVYLDNAATTFAPQSVIDAVAEHQLLRHGPVHRAVHSCGAEATEAYEQARRTVAQFLGAADAHEIVFVRGVTEAMNLLAFSLGEILLHPGDRVVATTMEHHSNMLPWMEACARRGAEFRLAPLTARGEIDLEQFEQLLNDRTRIIALTHISNVLGAVNPVRTITDLARTVGAVTVVDGAQAAARQRIDVEALGCDFYAISGHKMHAPTGVGALWGRGEILRRLPPWQTGGSMVEWVDLAGRTTWAPPPARFEAGTPNCAGAAGLAAAIDFLNQVGLDAIAAHETALTRNLVDSLNRIDGVHIQGDPAVILIAGLQGSGKTTFTGKLASLLKKQGRQVLLAACDIYRPAAIDQLKVIGEQAGVEVYAEPENKNALQIAENAIRHAKSANKKIVIVDTAGRLAIDETMMNEISGLKKALNPSETLFVVDSMTGQDAVNTAKAFNDTLNFDGVVLTKLDGDARGGAALSIRTVVEKPIKFISTGEKLDAIDVFHPDRMAQRILGMGDVISLVERAQQTFDEEEARRINKKIRKNQFSFDDFLSQLEQIKKMGNIRDLLGMIPGMGKALKGIDVDEDSFKPIEAIIRSMTPEERDNPDLINGSRRKRIADGSGSSIQQVNNLIKQFNEMRKMMKNMNKMGGKKGLANMNLFGK